MVTCLIQEIWQSLKGQNKIISPFYSFHHTQRIDCTFGCINNASCKRLLWCGGRKMNNNYPCRVVATFQVSSVVGEAYFKAVSPVKVIVSASGTLFHSTGRFSVKPIFLLLKLQMRINILRNFHKKQRIQLEEWMTPKLLRLKLLISKLLPCSPWSATK